MNPQVGQSTNLLLKQLVEATSGLGLSFITEAPQDGFRYSRVNGAWVRTPEPIIDGIVPTFADLPLGLTSPGLFDAYLVMEASGTFFVSRKPAGLYVRTAQTGTPDDWVYAATLTDSEV